MTKLDVLLLGTGSPLPSANRCGAGNVITAGETSIVIDLGWGAARRLVTSGVPIGSVDTVFFTHMHSDHITDFPDFLMMRWTMGAAKNPLTVYGPDGTREAMEGFRTALNPDVGYRIAHHGDKLPLAAMDVVIKEVPATPDLNQIATVAGMTVSSFEVDHRPVVPALGFRVDAEGASVVFSGDTKRTDNLVRASKGAGVLVSEAVSLELMQQRIDLLRGRGDARNAEMLEEACNYHAPTMDVAEMARDAGVGRLILSHLIPPIPDEGPPVEQFVAGMSDVYKGDILVARDMTRFSVGA